MKKTYLTIFFSFTILLGLSAQDVEIPQSQTPMIVKIAASWCPPCGEWGWTFFDQIYEDNNENAIFLSVHHSGDHTNTAALEITQNFNVFGQPRFILDGTDLNVSSSNASQKRVDFSTMVNTEITQTPDIQTGIEATHNNSMIQTDYSVGLFNNLSGEYYLGLYLVEKQFVGYQASIGPNAVHKTLLRKELTGNTFGTLLFNGDASAGDVFSGTVSATLENYEPTNLQVVSVIWKKEGNNYKVINSNVDKNVQFQLASSVQSTDVRPAELIVFPSLTRDEAQIRVILEKYVENAEISLVDLFGRKLAQIYRGSLSAGSTEIVFNRSAGMVAGTYYIVLSDGKTRNTERIIFE